MTSKYQCKNCDYDLMEGIGIKTETNRVFTKEGYDHTRELSKVCSYFCPKCLKTVRRKLGEDVHKQLSMKG